MAVEVLMPKFGLTMHEGTIQRFFKAPGEAVRAGEPLYEVETEKVLYEVEAPASGTLAIVLFETEATVECGQVVAIIAEPGDDSAAIASRYSARVPAPAASRDGENSPARASAPARSAAANDGGGQRAVSPIARKLATELGVDLDRIVGSGPGGRVTREDVERAAKATTRPASAPSAAVASATAAKSPTAQSIPMRGIRKTIAERMHASLQRSAQLTITTEADVTAATEIRERLKAEFPVTYTDLIIHAAARALVRHPRLNSRLSEGAIALIAEVNIGVAVALDEGLIVPVIRDAARKSLREIAAENRTLGEKAHIGRLGLDDVTGGTFTITNLGTYGIDAFTPILNPGETAILGVGRIVEKPAIWRGEIARRSMMTLSLTFDHRVVDGAPAASFLQSVIEILNYGER
jgi:pyruvate dehydrogenase E2 component (dihydrolipoamide acetyltransferase)